MAIRLLTATGMETTRNAAALTSTSRMALDARTCHRPTPLASTCLRVPRPYSDPSREEARKAIKKKAVKWVTTSPLARLTGNTKTWLCPSRART